METRPHLSPVWRPYAEAARANGARLTEAVLGPGRGGDRLDELVRRLSKEFDRVVQTAFAALPEAGEPACAPGCDHCCRTLPVWVSPVEAFSAAHRVRETLEAGVIGRTTAPAASPPGPAPAQMTPCPLLDEGGLCLVYSSRPLACRGCVSADASACAVCDADRPVPRSTAHQLGAAAMIKGVTDALDALRLVGRPVEFRWALSVVLVDDRAEKRWLRGEDVFAVTPSPPGANPSNP